MTAIQILIIALIQGITEFLPISSSGHLILIPAFTGWPDQGLAIDVAVHMGTLAAVLVYFWRDTKGLALAGFGAIGVAPARRAVEGSIYTKLFWALIIATLPVIIIGYFAKASGYMTALRAAEVIAWSSIIFGILLYVADSRAPVTKSLEKMAIRPALVIGIAQIFALIPGTSRAGVTMTAARYLGFNRTEAARFSMLLSIPTIAGAGFLMIIELLEKGSDAQIMDALLVAALSCVAALMAIHFLMRWLKHATMTAFVIYRLALGFGLLWLIYSGVLQ